MPKGRRKVQRKKSSKKSGPVPKLTKAAVATAVESLLKRGERVTTRSLHGALGGRGSYSTILELRKAVETEKPELQQKLPVSRSEVVAYIEQCHRSDLPYLEEALSKRRWLVRFARNHLVLSLHETAEGMAVLKSLKAVHRRDVGWSLEPTRMNYYRAREAGFLDNVEEATLRELERVASQAEFVNS